MLSEIPFYFCPAGQSRHENAWNVWLNYQVSKNDHSRADSLAGMRFDVIVGTLISRVRFVKYIHTKPANYIQSYREEPAQTPFTSLPPCVQPKPSCAACPCQCQFPCPSTPLLSITIGPPVSSGLPVSGPYSAFNKQRPQHAASSSWALSLRLSCSLLISSPPTYHAAARTISNTTLSSSSLRGA